MSAGAGPAGVGEPAANRVARFGCAGLLRDLGPAEEGNAMRERVLEAARGFVGTPYRHQGSRKGVGCDCLGLVRGVWRKVYGVEPELPGAYTPDWAERGGGEPLIEAAERHCRRIAVGDARPGDLVIFRWREGTTAKHCGILDGSGFEGGAGSEAAVASCGGQFGGEGGGRRVIHAYEGAAVVSSPLVPSWARRIAAAFRFPE